MNFPRLIALALTCFAATLASTVSAQSYFKQPNAHPLYELELEPLIEFGLADPPGDGTGRGIGLGLRASTPLLKRGLLKRHNDTLDLSVGLSWVYYFGGSARRGSCSDREQVPGVGSICVEVGGEAGDSNYLYLPVGAQWNLWLHRKFSVMGTLGLAIYLRNDEGDNVDLGVGPLVQVGGRWRFRRDMHLTLRLGFPTSSIGLGWFF